ncbi:MAG TPA: FAD:protein FMN transferase [Vicinamibacterales bacterium]|jgi:thiamine biosynthesis lipoprotein|nr:FAD:protein FMN transferase [Vicinamibacterales bacterium]
MRVLAVAIAAAMAVACTRTSERDHTRPSKEPFAFSKQAVTMGSSLQVTLWTADDPGATAAVDAVFAEFDRLDRMMSVWKEGSDVLRLNQAAGREPVRVSAETIEVLTAARQVSEWTGGKFDVTFGALSGLWRFDQDQDDGIPSRAAVAARLPDVDYTALDIDAARGTAFLRRPGMRAHLGGIGKGYAIDRAAAILRARGFHDFMIQSGGDLFVSGRRGGRPWRLGIRDPRGPVDRSFATLDLTNGTFSTSGDYERFFIKDGRRYHHILDPDLGEPARGCRSVTILADTAVLADGLSTGVFVLGPEKGMALIERLPDVEGVIVTSQNRVLVSSGLIAKLALIAQPTDAP